MGLALNRRQADRIVGGLVLAVLLVGGAASWDAYRSRVALHDMGGSMMADGAMNVHGTNPLWLLLSTVVVAAVILGFYAIMRPDPDQATASESNTDGPDIEPEGQSRSRLLDLLPEDERRILEPVLTSPGLTQIELRDRSDFSKSKVSQTVSALEKRGLLYRERQGRTYRVYPSDDLRDDPN